LSRSQSKATRSGEAQSQPMDVGTRAWLQWWLRSWCLRYGAALVCTSAKGGTNCQLLRQYLHHCLTGFKKPFSEPPQLADFDRLFVPSGADSPPLLASLLSSSGVAAGATFAHVIGSNAATPAASKATPGATSPTGKDRVSSSLVTGKTKAAGGAGERESASSAVSTTAVTNAEQSEAFLRSLRALSDSQPQPTRRARDGSRQHIHGKHMPGTGSGLSSFGVHTSSTHRSKHSSSLSGIGSALRPRTPDTREGRARIAKPRVAAAVAGDEANPEVLKSFFQGLIGRGAKPSSSSRRKGRSRSGLKSSSSSRKDPELRRASAERELEKMKQNSHK